MYSKYFYFIVKCLTFLILHWLGFVQKHYIMKKSVIAAEMPGIPNFPELFLIIVVHNGIVDDAKKLRKKQTLMRA